MTCCIHFANRSPMFPNMFLSSWGDLMFLLKRRQVYKSDNSGKEDTELNTPKKDLLLRRFLCRRRYGDYFTLWFGVTGACEHWFLWPVGLGYWAIWAFIASICNTCQAFLRHICISPIGPCGAHASAGWQGFSPLAFPPISLYFGIWNSNNCHLGPNECPTKEEK